MEKRCFRALMVASQPARQRSARRNQRCFCYLARLAERRPRAGSATFFKPSGCASRLVLRRRKTAVRGSHLWRSPGPGEGPRQSLEKHQARWCRHSQLATRLRSRKRIGLARRRSSTKKAADGYRLAGATITDTPTAEASFLRTDATAAAFPVQTVAHDTFHEPAEGHQQAGGGGLSGFAGDAACPAG